MKAAHATHVVMPHHGAACELNIGPEWDMSRIEDIHWQMNMKDMKDMKDENCLHPVLDFSPQTELCHPCIKRIDPHRRT